MGPPTKKRKESPNCTLLDFFSSADGSVKRTRGSRIQRWSLAASREVIVIDSDSDDGKETGNGSKAPRTGVSEDSHSLASAPVHSGDKDIFGLPSTLLCPPNLCVEALGSKRPQPQVSPKPGHSASSSFGASVPLLEQVTNIPESATATNSVVHQSMTSMMGGNSVNDPTIGSPIGEWAVGDDETVTLGALDNGAGIGGEAESSDERVCPVCDIGLTGVPLREAHTHVDQCLNVATLKNQSIITQNPISVLTKPDWATSDDADSNGQGGDLYTVLMNSHKENETWREADAAANWDSRPTSGIRRKAPFYKVLQGMPIAVDAFCYGAIPGVTAYFLTHAHSDHYTSLGSRWKCGPIYCSEETAKLIIHMLAVDPRWVHPLPLDIPTIIPNTGGVSVTLIEANHCPGSCLFVFEGQQTIDAGDSVFKSPFTGSSRIFRYLHCGDFRASPRHVVHPAVYGKYIDHIYLDTTYLDPKYTFSPQPVVISACADFARRLVIGGVGENANTRRSRISTVDIWIKSSASPPSAERGDQDMLQDRTLVIVGTYSIGKERIVKAIAQALEAKIYCDSRKTAILRCQADKELHALLTGDPAEANVHILPLGSVTSDSLSSYLQRFKGTFSRIIGFRPTGWTYSPPLRSDLNSSIQSIISHGQSRTFSCGDLRPSQKSLYNVQIYGVPYSEHSSFFELTCFAMSCDWGRMIPTVNVGNQTSRIKMTKWLRRWEAEKRGTKPPTIQPRTIDYW